MDTTARPAPARSTTQPRSSTPSDPTAAERAAKQRAEREADWQRLAQQLGTRYAACTIDGFQVYDQKQAPVLEELRTFARELVANVCNGRNLILYGPAGTGKDHALAALLRIAVLDHGARQIAWRNGQDLAGEFREAMHSGEESYLVDKLASASVLAISDPLPPMGGLTEFQCSGLFRVLDRRYRDRKAVWITMNVAGATEAEARLSAPILDRLRHQALTLACNWPSYRTREAGQT